LLAYVFAAEKGFYLQELAPEAWGIWHEAKDYLSTLKITKGLELPIEKLAPMVFFFDTAPSLFLP